MEVNQSPRKAINEVVVDCQDFNRPSAAYFGPPNFVHHHHHHHTTASGGHFGRVVGGL